MSLADQINIILILLQHLEETTRKLDILQKKHDVSTQFVKIFKLYVHYDL